MASPVAACVLVVLAFLLRSWICSPDAFSPRKPQEPPWPCAASSFLCRLRLDRSFSAVQPAISPGFPVWAGNSAMKSASPFDLGRVMGAGAALPPSYVASELIKDVAGATLPPSYVASELIQDVVSPAPSTIFKARDYASRSSSSSGVRTLKAFVLWPLCTVKSLIGKVVFPWFFAELRFIRSSSMMPTFEIGERIITEKVSYYFKNPQINDIVLFRPPKFLQYNASTVFIKRVVAKAGDTVEVKDCKLFVNGKAPAEEFTAEPLAYEMSELRVPKGCLWVLGDNRNHSNDSHLWGPLPIRNVLARAVYRYWPPERSGPVASPS